VAVVTVLVTKVVLEEEVVVVAVLVEGLVVVVDFVEVVEDIVEDIVEDVVEDLVELLDEVLVEVLVDEDEVLEVENVEADVVVRGRFPGTPRARTVDKLEI
jgi:hypothetical protein